MSNRQFLAALALWCLPTFATAQQASDLFSAWETVPQDQSGLVILVNADLTGSSLFLGDKDFGDSFSIPKWDFDLPFLKQIRVEPGTYEVKFLGPIESVTVATQPGKLTFLRIERFEPESGEPGVTIASWTGQPSKEIIEVFGKLVKIGAKEAFYADALKLPGKTLYFDTTPPFEIPPPPPKD